MKKYQIFISYRRDGGADLAGRISDRLTALGYSVFLDVESMRSENLTISFIVPLRPATTFF
ncbi:MAG: toll/interleukin-1 receptor domain-containing protein [Clostridia bacterium]|nr:toll/interleukin-1 receptor domain-containing protein [Clostridia bacterium]